MYLNIYTQQKISSENTVLQPVKNIRTFYENVIFITMFRTHHLPYNQRAKTSSNNHNLFKNTLNTTILILFVPCIVSKLNNKSSFTSTKIYRHQALVSLVHVSANPRRHRQGVLSVVLVKLFV
jgi:hypothetical protein